ncbi:MAG TPA: glycosyltransferase family 87 protein [Caulobacteraceae bacterium]|nr:glycosyltransferase family 87 protein [Caulobacteraceae bacterium]
MPNTQHPASEVPPIGRLGLLRAADWLTAERARAYGWSLLAVAVVIGGVWIALSPSGLDPSGRPLGADFTSFWSAARLTLSGAPAGVYSVSAHHAVQNAIFGRDTGYAAFFYPPIFLMICAPFGLLPYLPALAAWLLATGAAYWRVTRAWLGDRFGAMPIFAFPAVLVNVGNGQNGFLSAALFGAGALWLETRPIFAGVCLGALAYKPQLGLIIPVALAIAGRWKTFAAAALTVLALAALSLGLFGPAAWQGFLADSGLARAALELRLVGDAKMQSAFAALRLWGGPLWLAYGVQALVALAAAAGLVWLRRRAPRSGAEGPAMIVAALLASPFLLDYDLILLAIPLAWMLRQGARTGFLDWEKTTMAAAFVLPLVSRTLATAARLPIAPLVVGGLFAVLLRRGALGLDRRS